MSPLRRSSLLVLLLCFVLPALDLPAIGQDFSIIVLPDTQNEAQFFPQVMNAQTKWIAANAQARNVQMVLGVGDIVNDGASTAQQQNADAAVRVLDNASIPYMLAIGNHDYDGFNPKSRVVTGYNHWFGPARYAGKAYYQGSFPSGSNENFYGVLTIGGKQYLFLVLEFRPRSTSLDWAESILSANPGKEAIVVVHSYLKTNGTREGTCDTQDMPAGNANGQQMWSRLRKHSNVIMVLNGHFTGGTVAHRRDVGDSGTLVNQIFADLQTFPNGGNGWLEIITFHPASNSISVQTYSPFLDQFMTGSAQQFTVPYHNPNPQTGSGTIRGKVRNQSNCAAISGVTVKSGAGSAVTAADGTYSFSVAPGSYSVSASGTGWNTGTQTETVSDSLTTQLDFYLTAAGSPTPSPTPTPTPAPTGCSPGAVSPSVTICSPLNGSTLSSPVHVVAATRDSVAVSFVQIYVDGSPVLTKSGGSLDTLVTMAAGARRVTVQAKDSAGVIFKQTVNITVH